MNNKYLSVSALNKYLFYKFDNDLNLRNVYLKAEISNVRLSKGILYFVNPNVEHSESSSSTLKYYVLKVSHFTVFKKEAYSDIIEFPLDYSTQANLLNRFSQLLTNCAHKDTEYQKKLTVPSELFRKQVFLLSEQADGQGCAGFSQSEGDAEAFFLLTAVITQEEGGAHIPGPSMAEYGILLDGHTPFLNFVVPLGRECVFFVHAHIGTQLELT